MRTARFVRLPAIAAGLTAAAAAAAPQLVLVDGEVVYEDAAALAAPP